ncbi:MAG: CDP-glucose 4,6-dehydratase [Thermoguttaceae bacterium]
MSMRFDEVFRDRSVFVTGHTGFKGSWLCLWLASLGARVTGYALEPPTEPNHFSVAGIGEFLQESHVADIRDLDRLEAAIKRAEPDLVLHLAAQSIVRAGYQQPHETFEVNVMGTVNVLEAVRRLARPCAVVAVTSDKCYQNREQVWGYREDDAMGERDPYGGSKGAAELAIRSYRHSFFPPERLAEHGVKLASARAGNVVGGGDWTPHALIVDIVRALSQDEPVEIRSPGAFRPWQHVLQALSGYLALAAKLLESDDPRFASAWNIGPAAGNEIPVREVVEIVIREWGGGEWRDVSRDRHVHESVILRLAIDKALWELGWQPRWSIHETLRQTVHWYHEFYGGNVSMREVSLAQIGAYQSAPSAADVPQPNLETAVNP